MQRAATQPVKAQYSQWRTDYLSCRKYMGSLPANAAGPAVGVKGLEYERCVKDKMKGSGTQAAAAAWECNKCMQLQMQSAPGVMAQGSGTMPMGVPMRQRGGC
mmetsp:Transcript_24573/g.70110  ORF Transcript_24573/g.70110 Transcript_24573/m.70110 type:complete len:103 (-) Transcript_24573:63-371(-)